MRSFVFLAIYQGKKPHIELEGLKYQDDVTEKSECNAKIFHHVIDKRLSIL